MKTQKSFLFYLLLLHWARQLFLGIPPFISDPRNLCLFLDLDLLLAFYAKSRGLIYTILHNMYSVVVLTVCILNDWDFF